MEDQKESKNQKILEFSERRAHALAIFEVLKAKKRFLALTFLLATIGTLCGHYLQETKYTATTTLFVQALEDPTAANYLLNQQYGHSNKAERIETYIRFLASDAFFMTVAQKLKHAESLKALQLDAPNTRSILNIGFWKKTLHELISDTPTISTSERAKNITDLAGLIKPLTVFETDYSHFIFIKTTSLDPQTSKIIANLVAEEFVQITNERGIQEIEQIKNFVETKIKETDDRLKTNEQLLVEFKKKNNVIATDKTSSILAERFAKISTDYEAIKMQLEENQKLIAFFEQGQRAANSDTNTAPTKTNPDGTRVYGAKETALILYRKMEQLKKQKAQVLAQDDATQNWRTQELDSEITKTAKAFDVYVKKAGDKNLFLYMTPQKILQRINELKEESEVLKTKLSSHQKLQDQLSAQLETIPSLAQKQIVLENSLRVDTDNFTNLKNKLTELEIQKISQRKEVRIDQIAQTPGPSAKGNVLLKLIFSSLIALLLGISIIVGIESIDPTIKHRSDLVECGIEFIGDIPLIDFENLYPKTFANSSHIVTHESPESIEAMSFKYIRARIESYRYKSKKNHLVISISSGNANDGKSLIAANLCVSLAQLKRSVLLIDCDLRRPSQNAYFDVNPSYGLVDLLNTTHDLNTVLIKNVKENLDYLPAGFCHNNSTEYISSEKFRILIHSLKEDYDYIVIDTPPVFAAVDSSIIANYSDMPILIANFRETKKYNVSEAYNQIIQISYKRVYGIINKAILSSARFHYYGYHNTTYTQTESNAIPLGASKETSADIDQFMKNIKKKMS